MKRVILVALVGLSVSAPAFGVVAPEVPGDLVVSKVDTTHYPQVTMIVAPPRLLAPRDLPADAFSVTENGERREVNVARLPNSGLQIALVLDPTVPPELFRAAQGAALDFVLRLPIGTRVALIDAGAPPEVTLPATTDLVAATRAVGDLTRRPDRAIYDAVRRADAELTPASQARHTVVVFTGGRDRSSSITLDALKRRLTVRGTSVYAIELSGGDTGGALATLAAGAGGESVRVASTELVGAYQRVADVLLNQYRVSFAARSRGRAQLSVGVAADGISGERSLGVELTALEGTSRRAGGAVPSERGGGRAVAEPLAAGVAIAMALLAGGLLVLLGRAGLRARSTPSSQRSAR